MQEEFEKTVRERMHTFGIQPSHQVWGEIDAVLNKKKHRRVFVGWWILLGLVVFGGAILYYEKDSINRDGLNQQPVIIADTASNAHITQNLTPSKTERDEANPLDNKKINAKDNSKPKQNPPTVTANATDGSNNIPKTKANTASSGKPVFFAKTRFPSLVTSGADNSQTTAQASTKFVELPKAVASIPSKQTPTNNEVSVAQALPPQAAQMSADTATGAAMITRDSSFAEQATTKPFKPSEPATKTTITAQKKHAWFVTLSAGTTRTVTFGQFNGSPPGNTLLAANAAYANVPAVTALNFFKYDITAPGTGFNIAFGALYEKELSPRWKISGGLSFNYLSNTQRVGSSYKSALSVTAGNLYNITAPQITVQSYYQPGKDALLVNKAWQAQLPVSVGYVFNPKGKTKFLFNGGLSFSWLFNSQWLIPDNRYGKLYYSDAVFNNTAFNWQVGPAIQLPNQWKFGLQYQQSFGTVAKNYITPKLYWQHISIYTAIPFGGKRRH